MSQNRDRAPQRNRRHARPPGLRVVLAAAAALSSLPARVAAEAPVARPAVHLVGPAWARHVIDDTSRGADGVRLRDIDADGDRDAISAWEEGGVVRIYRHPPPDRCGRPWPAVTVGRVKSPEDALLVDLDADGNVDAVSCCEGRTRTIFLHRAPARATRAEYWDAARWKTISPSCTRGRAMWMFAEAADVDGNGRSDIVAGAKGSGAHLGWMPAPADVWNADAWTFHPLQPVGWVMSIIRDDHNTDGWPDVLVSDRRGPSSGVFWLVHPGRPAHRLHADPALVAGPDRARRWKRLDVGARGEEVMFVDLADLDGDGDRDVIAAVRPHTIAAFLRGPSGYVSRRVALPSDATGTMKSVRVARWGHSNRARIVVSCEHAERQRRGVFWFFWDEVEQRRLLLHDISGPQGVKFDLLQLDDVDADGDPDVLTCEERTNLGVLWYENPASSTDTAGR